MRGPSKHALLRDATSATRFLCRNCRPQQRGFASSLHLSRSPALKASPIAGLARLSKRQLLAIDGVEAAKFLQGLITGNVTSKDGLPRHDAFYTGFLNATGRVLHDVFVYPVLSQAADGPVFYIEVDASEIDRLAKYVKRHKLRAKVNIRKVGLDDANIWQAWDDSERGTTLSTAAAAAAAAAAASGDNVVVISDPRAPGLGYRIMQLNNKTPAFDLDQTTEDAYTIRRYLHGVPEGQDEMPREQALPLESNMELMNAIDFHKGCYVGQELTIRTKHRGVVRKRILPVIIYQADKAPPETLHYEPEQLAESPDSITADMIPSQTSIGRVEKKGRSAGKWLKGVGNIGLGLCRLETMTDLTLPGEPASSTFKEGDEFAVRWGGEDKEYLVKARAFVPDWLRAGLVETK